MLTTPLNGTPDTIRSDAMVNPPSITTIWLLCLLGTIMIAL